MKNKEILWEQTLDSGFSWLAMGFEIAFWGFLISVIGYHLIQICKYGIRVNLDIFVELLEYGLVIGGYIGMKVHQLFVASTLEYQIKNKGLVYKWGVKKGTSVEIPFSDITAINLVEYDNTDESTIYVMTKEDYEVHRFNFDDNSPRHTYTLEKIKQGPEVYQLMMKQWRAAYA